jgi:hypothetical protein
MRSMPSCGQPPESWLFVFEEDDTDRYAVHWRGSEWGRDYEGHLVDYVLIAMDDAKRDAEVIGQVNKLGSENNNGRKHCATSVTPQFGEVEMADPQWRVPAVLPTGDGGFEIATLTESTGQDRYRHQRERDGVRYFFQRGPTL